MIDEDRTMQLFGYVSIDLKPKSHKPIVRICEMYGGYRIIKKSDYRDICHRCSLIGKNNPMYGVRLCCELNGMYNKYHTNETKNKMSKPHKKIINTNKMGKHLIGTHHNDKTKIKMSCTRQGIDINDFNGFLTDQKYCSLFNNKFKELIRNKFHNKCYLCDEVQKRKLSVHHVNYDKNCLCQKTCEFVPLCGSCHAKTNHNRQYWEDLIMCYLYPNRYFMVDI